MGREVNSLEFFFSIHQEFLFQNSKKTSLVSRQSAETICHVFFQSWNTTHGLVCIHNLFSHNWFLRILNLDMSSWAVN
jgi:hypothetical protein